MRKRATAKAVQVVKPKLTVHPKRLLGDLRRLIEAARRRTAQFINSELVKLYWNVGDRIRRDLLQGKRAEYGEEIISTLADELTAEYGQGFGRRNLFYMTRFVECFPESRIVNALSAQLSWTHFRLLIALDDPFQREFYAEMCRLERWSTRTLEAQIRGMLYQRTALSKKPEVLAKRELDALRDGDRMSPDLVFRDPYLLDFLGLKDAYGEKDMEAAILGQLERFLLELGAGFSFVARQKRITVDHEDYYIDLLFYHRVLRRLVAVELKLGKFQAADKGQMELYLCWLDRYEREEGEESPLGLILCAERSAEHVELLRLEESGIRVAEYLTELPPRPLLEKKLQEAIQVAQHRLTVLPEWTGEPA
ncbi:MAG TPA: PDDEXK nuclease domain-containing protein [Thermoanaerobaculia bacterium]|nr:PDDEXK nuclease domain-containing protein [Thermoanaerobaculia bacterium]